MKEREDRAICLLEFYLFVFGGGQDLYRLRECSV